MEVPSLGRLTVGGVDQRNVELGLGRAHCEGQGPQRPSIRTNIPYPVPYSKAEVDRLGVFFGGCSGDDSRSKAGLQDR
jgi:hypothetical protein